MKQRRTRTRRRTARSNTKHTRRQTGGQPQPVGQGLQGAAFRDGNDILKKTSIPVGEKEKAVAQRLELADPGQDYTLYGKEFVEKGDKYEIRMPDGGVSLNIFEDAIWLLTRKNKPTAEKIKEYKEIVEKFRPEIPKILQGFDSLLEFIPTMHEKGVTHSDMGPANLVWNGRKLRLIDWGMATLKREGNDAEFQREMESDRNGLINVKKEDIESNLAFINSAEYHALK
jgi:hypothetical protein